MKPRTPPRELLRALGSWPWFCATAGGLGHMWPASGTWGSLPPAALFVGMGWMGAPLWAHVIAQAVLCAMASAGCLHHGGRVEAVVGRKDPGVVVVDEVAGMALTFVFALVAVGLRGHSLAGVMPNSLMLTLAALGFFWFRVMDVVKPPPARGLQRLQGGLGVLVDDLVVAPYAAFATVASLEMWVATQPLGG